jgi:hypothetical protein
VLDCGSTLLRVWCEGCGVVSEFSLGCKSVLLCAACRAVIAARKRATFKLARAAVLAEAKSRGLLVASPKHGRWSEKFLTLTAPHVQTDTIRLRIERVFNAWPRFLRRLNKHFKEHRIKSVEWIRVFEWTPGESDKLGHPHLHLWIFSPFLPQDMLQRAWEAALLEAGCPPELTVGRTLPYIKPVTDAEDASNELIKYLLKDIDANGEKVAPVIYAQVYETIDGRRSMQASRGFMGRARQEEKRCECGCLLPKHIRRVKREATVEGGDHG